MDTPFPGMDPYLEQPSFWPDVHHRLITVFSNQLQPALGSKYRAVITPYVAIESIELLPVHRDVPDVAIFERDPFAMSSNIAVAVEVAPLTLPAIIETPVEYGRIEIRSVREQTLVTAIELLSPVNKRPGVDGADAYEKKRQELFNSTANLLEIDLLRAGKRPRMGGALPSAPYFVFLSRARRRSVIEVWPLAVDKAIKPIPVPLLHPDPDVSLDLGAAIHFVDRSARYDYEIDYQQAPPPPGLPPAEMAWLDAHLRERGLRP